LDARIPFEEKSFVLAREAESPGEQPALHFYVDDTRVELILLPAAWKGRSLRKKGGQLTGGNIKEVEKLLAGDPNPYQPLVGTLDRKRLVLED
jgi:hypothetical protein